MLSQLSSKTRLPDCVTAFRPRSPAEARLTPAAMNYTHHLVAMPYPGRGHVNPMLCLCELLAARAGGGLLVTFVVTEEWLSLIAPAVCRLSSGAIRFRTIPNVIPSELNRGSDFVGFLEAVFTKMKGPFEELLERLQQEEEHGEPPVAGIVSDTYMPWAVTVGNSRGIPIYSLFTMSASFFALLYHFDLVASVQSLPLHLSEKQDVNLDFIPGVTSMKMADIRTFCSHQTPTKLSLEAISMVNKTQCLLFTSFYELEPRALEALKAKFPFPVYAVGPSIPHVALQQKPTWPVKNGCDAAVYHGWLDSQPKRSVLYISLGSFLSVSGEQMSEIAMGLRASGVRFLWVARRDPSRMQELSGSMGLVVPWCDQLKVLCHPSVGGFLTHCGWNSTLEAVFAGVPTLTFPIFWDQPPDSRLMVDEWKMGLSLRGEVEEGRVVGRDQIAKTVTRLMDLEGDESKELRRRAGELKEACRRAVQDGGSSTVSIDAFVARVASGKKEG